MILIQAVIMDKKGFVVAYKNFSAAEIPQLEEYIGINILEDETRKIEIYKVVK